MNDYIITIKVDNNRRRQEMADSDTKEYVYDDFLLKNAKLANPIRHPINTAAMEERVISFKIQYKLTIMGERFCNVFNVTNCIITA